MIISQIITL